MKQTFLKWVLLVAMVLSYAARAAQSAWHEWNQDVRDRDLSDRHCCDGHECGCYGVTVWEHHAGWARHVGHSISLGRRRKVGYMTDIFDDI